MRLSGYEDVGVSPGSLIPFNEAIARFDTEFSCKEEDLHKADFCFFLFLYSKKYQWENTLEIRKQKIKLLLDNKDGNRERLRRIVESTSNDSSAFNARTFEYYCNVATVIKMYFESNHAKGGFPMGVPLLRFQIGATCYSVSVCMWYSLLRQKHSHDHSYEVIDTARVMRHRVIINDEALEKRVIHNKGEFAIDLAVGLTERPLNDDHWEYVKFTHNFTAKVDALTALIFCEKFGPGLVTRFRTPATMKDALRKNKGTTTAGYWLFDGDSKYCEGEFVAFGEREGFDKVLREETERLKTIWDKQEKHAAIRDKDKKDPRAKIFFPSTPRNGKIKEKKDADAPGSSGLHSMVLLGGHTEMVYEKPKSFLMLLNWWHEMPILVVSPNFLQDCGASELDPIQINFLSRPITADNPDVQWKSMLMAECDFVDEGENSDIPDSSWMFQSPRNKGDY